MDFASTKLTEDVDYKRLSEQIEGTKDVFDLDNLCQEIEEEKKEEENQKYDKFMGYCAISDSDMCDSLAVPSIISRATKCDILNQADFYEGYLRKKSPCALVGWQLRYFVLKNRRLVYYKKRDDINQKPKGIINFDHVECIIKTNKEKLIFNLSLKGISREFELKASNINEFQMWIQKLKKNVEYSLGYQKHLTLDTTLISLKVWRYDRVSEKQFLKMADIGDILLFRGKRIQSKITRAFTKSQFDHVAMILKFEQESDEVFMLEANSNTGVGITRWKNFKPIQDEIYEAVFYRHLYAERNSNFLLQVERFIKVVVGNPYAIKLFRILFQRKTINDDLEKRRFFCSELVAKAYKEMGLIGSKISCTKFFPGTFSEDSNLKLLSNASLGEQKMILFEEEKDQLNEFDIQFNQLPKLSVIGSCRDLDIEEDDNSL